MNHAVAVDASVAIKWVVAEEFSEQANALLAQSVAQPIVGPPHLSSEVANALYQRTRRTATPTTLAPEEAEQALERFLALGIELLSPAGLYARAFAFARTHALPSLYDTLYVVLAQMLGVALWSADRRLLATASGAAPWVHAISDYPPS